MVLEITDAGIQTESLDEIILDLENKLKAIFGEDINLEQNSFDGQLVNIFAQYGFDLQQLIVKLFNSTNINYAEGTALESLCYSIANRRRKGGTKTVVEVDVTTSRDDMLIRGIGDENEVFTVEDDAGNKFQLQTTVTIALAGTNTLTFIAEEAKAISVLPNTITTIATPVVGIDSVRNNGIESVTGIDFESDIELRTGFKLAVSQPSVGYEDGMLGSILILPGVKSVKSYENDTDAVDSDGLKPKSIYVIVDGGDDQAIGGAIIKHKGAGCGTNGVPVTVTIGSGDVRIVRFDRPTPVNLTIKAIINESDGKMSLIESAILGVKYGLSETAKVQDYYDAVNAIDGVIIDNITISKNGSDFFNVLETSGLTDIFISNSVVYS